ncbi:MAG: family 43 glycosylhydrolase, partial [Aristaeellaceae bacterium]
NVLPNQTGLWAPELHHYQEHWYAFYAGDYEDDNTQHRMYVARSVTDDPMGEWETPVKLELPEDQWAIDGTFFEYSDGRIFFIWSGWKNQSQGTSLWKQYLYIAQLETGDPTHVVSTERVMISKPQYYWEMSVLPQNEGPAVLVSPDGTYYCMYAGNYSGSNEYVVGAVRLQGDPLDPDAWVKLPEPVLRSNEALALYAPGHASFTKSPDGTEDWIIFHTAKADSSGWNRNGRAQRITWVDDVPTVPEGVISNDELIPLPSGEKVDRILIQAEDGVLSDGAVLLEGLTTTPAVQFPTREASVTIVYDAPRDGQYPVYVRHNSNGQTTGAIWLNANDALNATVLSAQLSNGPDQFIPDCQLMHFNKGLNKLTITAQSDVAIDLIIIDQTPGA